DAVRRERIPEGAAAKALVAIGRGAVRGVIEGLRDGNSRVRKVATESLLAIEPEKHREIGEDLRKLLIGGEEQPAMWALARRFPPSDAAISALIGCVMDDHFTWGHFAAEALGEVGPDAAAALPYLIRVLEENAGRYGRAAEALVEIGYVHPEVILPPLIKALGDRASASRTEMFRYCLFQALGKLGPAAKDAIPALIGLMTGPSEKDSDRQ